MDEPTNDLDIETLELLEELLADYQGTLLLVSHDRRFIDNTVTHSWFFEGDGRITEYVGGYADLMYARAQKALARPAPVTAREPEPVSPPKGAPAQKKNRKLSYKLQLELEALPARLEQLESRIEQLQTDINMPDFFNRPSVETQAVLDALKLAETELDDAFLRWEALV